MANFPTLLSLECTGEPEHPIILSLAWTLANGQYKAVYVKPSNAWQEELFELGTGFDLSLQDLNELGQTDLEIVRELQQDIAGDRLYTQDAKLAQAAMERLFAAVETEFAYECTPLVTLFSPWTLAEFEDQRRDVMDELGLHLANAEDELLIHRALYAQQRQPHNPTAIWQLADGKPESDDQD